MSDPFLGELRIFSFNHVPTGWAACDGQVLPINQNQALFALLGTNYGGNGMTTFALPDLRGRIPMHLWQPNTQPGERAGAETHTVTVAELPTHAHGVLATNTAGDSVLPTGNVLANVAANLYAPMGPGQALPPGSLSNVGNGLAHDNMSPYITLTIGIALQGVFPTFN